VIHLIKPVIRLIKPESGMISTRPGLQTAEPVSKSRKPDMHTEGLASQKKVSLIKACFVFYKNRGRLCLTALRFLQMRLVPYKAIRMLYKAFHMLNKAFPVLY